MKIIERLINIRKYLDTISNLGLSDNLVFESIYDIKDDMRLQVRNQVLYHIWDHLEETS